MDWKARFRNKTFWLALISAIVLLTQQLGLEVFPESIMDIANTALLILVILGVVADPSTQGLLDTYKGRDE